MSQARQLRVGLLTQVCAGAALPLLLLWPLDALDDAAVVLIALCTPVFLTAVVLAVELGVGAVIDAQKPPTSFAMLCRLCVAETIVSIRAFAWRQAFASTFAEPLICHDAQRPALLLIHGYACNRAVWKPILDSGHLANMNVATLNLEPAYGSIDDYVSQVHGAVVALRIASGAARVMLVGHSMGGLVCRAYLRDHDLAEVAHVVTIATPHMGTVFGGFGMGINAKQMKHRSQYLQLLETSSTLAHRQAMTVIISGDDNLVVPRSSGVFDHADNVVLRGIGHLEMIEHPEVWRRVVEAAKVGVGARIDPDAGRIRHASVLQPASGLGSK